MSIIINNASCCFEIKIKFFAADTCAGRQRGVMRIFNFVRENLRHRARRVNLRLALFLFHAFLWAATWVKYHVDFYFKATT